jgi:hypothetical protein
MRPGSIVHSHFNKKRLIGLKFAHAQYDFVRNNYPEITGAAVDRLFMEACGILAKIPLKKREFRAAKKECADIIQMFRLRIIKDKKARLPSIIYALISFVGTSTLHAVLRLKSRLIDWREL